MCWFSNGKEYDMIFNRMPVVFHFSMTYLKKMVSDVTSSPILLGPTNRTYMFVFGKELSYLTKKLLSVGIANSIRILALSSHVRVCVLWTSLTSLRGGRQRKKRRRNHTTTPTIYYPGFLLEHMRC